MADICIPQAVAGAGGIGGGGGAEGQPSLEATGHGAASYGVPIIRTTAGLTADFTVQLTKDRQGTIPMQLYSTNNIKLACLAQQRGCYVFTVDCQYLGNGRLQFSLGPQQTNCNQGLHYAQFQCRDQEGILRHIFKCCIQIQHSLASQCPCGFRPLTIAEVRMQIYDTSGEQNELLDDLQFSDIVIARCMDRAVQDWNQMPPQLSRNLSVSNFPFKSNLCTGAAGYLFRMASYRYMRNQMRHSNAGLTVDDNDKGELYLRMAQAALEEWKSFVQTKKSQLNMLQCMGSISDVFMESSQRRWWR